MKVLLLLALVSVALGQTCSNTGLVRRWIKQGEAETTWVTTALPQPESAKTKAVCPGLATKASQCCDEAAFTKIQSVVDKWVNYLNGAMDQAYNVLVKASDVFDELADAIDDAVKNMPKDANGNILYGTQAIDPEKFKTAFRNLLENMVKFLKAIVARTATCVRSIINHYKGLLCLSCYTEEDLAQWVTVTADNGNFGRSITIKFHTTVCENIKAGCLPLVKDTIGDAYNFMKQFFTDLGVSQGTDFAGGGFAMPSLRDICEGNCDEVVCHGFIGKTFTVSKEAVWFSELEQLRNAYAIFANNGEGSAAAGKRDSALPPIFLPQIDMKRDVEQTSDSVSPSMDPTGFNSIEEGINIPASLKSASEYGAAGRLVVGASFFFCLVALLF